MHLRDYQQALLSDALAAFRAGTQSVLIALGCGGGKTVIAAELAKHFALQGMRVLFLAHRQELVQQAQRTFEADGVPAAYFSCGMVQTVCRRTGRIPPPGLIIIDECHHSAAGSYTKVFEAFPQALRAGITATPERLDGKGLGEVFQKILHGPSVEQLIKMQYLAPYKYFAPQLVDTSQLHTRMGEFVQSEVIKLMEADIYGDVIQHWLTLGRGQQAICYCAGVSNSRRTAEQFTAAGYPAAHVDGTTPQAERAHIIEAFRRGEIRVLCNVDIVGEGFDVPDCAVSILLRPTKSLSLYIQQAMRCMRFRPGKTAIILDHVGNAQRHNLPDFAHDWSLEGKKKRGTDDEESVSIKQCPKCAYTHYAALFCPNCGYKYPVKQAKPLIADENAQLVELKPGSFRIATKTLEQCHTVADLQQYAKENGYKPGWAYYKAKQWGLIKK